MVGFCLFTSKQNVLFNLKTHVYELKTFPVISGLIYANCEIAHVNLTAIVYIYINNFLLF